MYDFFYIPKEYSFRDNFQFTFFDGDASFVCIKYSLTIFLCICNASVSRCVTQFFMVTLHQDTMHKTPLDCNIFSDLDKIFFYITHFDSYFTRCVSTLPWCLFFILKHTEFIMQDALSMENYTYYFCLWSYISGSTIVFIIRHSSNISISIR